MTLLGAFNIISLYGVGLLIFVVTYFGALILLKPASTASTMVGSVLLYLLLICSYAVINTAANTVLSLGLVLVLIMLARLRSINTGRSGQSKEHVKLFVLLACCYTLIFAGYYFLYGYFDCQAPNLGDNAVYARIAAYIRDAGVETNRLDPEVRQVATPYHYLELHAGALLSLLSRQNVTYALLISATSLFITYLLGIFYTIVLKITNSSVKVQAILIAAGGLFLHGYYLFFYSSFQFTSDIAIFANNAYELKFMSVYIAFALAAYFYVEKAWLLSYISLILTAVFTIVAAPAVFGLAFFWLLVVVFRQNFTPGLCLAFAATFLFSGLFFLIFYKGINNFEQGNSLVGESPFAALLTPDQFMLMVRIIVGGTLKLVTAFALPLLLILVLLLIKYRNFQNLKIALYNYKGFLISVLLIVPGSCTVWALLNQMVDSIQFFILPALAAVNVTLFVLLVIAVHDSVQLKRIVSVIAAVAVAISVLNVWQIKESYASECKEYLGLMAALEACVDIQRKELGGIKSQVVVFNKSLRPGSSIYEKNLTTYGLGQNHLLYISDAFLYVPINILDLPLHPDDLRIQVVEKYFISNSYLGRYIDKNKHITSSQQGIQQYINKIEPVLYITDVEEDRYLAYFSDARLLYKLNNLNFYCID
jgi:hypothetical protein